MVKFHFVLLFFLVTFNTGSAQTNVYHAFPDSNAYWCEDNVWGTTCAYHDTYTIFMNGDTVIGTQPYHKLYATGVVYCNPTGPPPYPPTYFNVYKGAIRQDIAQKKVFVCRKDITTEELLYDFNLVAGDILKNWLHVVTITSVDSILTGSSYRKRWWTDATTGAAGNDTIYIIEGIGSSAGLLVKTGGAVESGSILEGFTQNGQNIYKYNSFYTCFFDVGIMEIPENINVKISPNPSTGKFQISLPDAGKKYSLEISDPLGKVILRKTISGDSEIDQSGQSKGIYFLKIYSDGKYLGSKKIVIQ